MLISLHSVLGFEQGREKYWVVIYFNIIGSTINWLIQSVLWLLIKGNVIMRYFKSLSVSRAAMEGPHLRLSQ